MHSSWWNVWLLKYSLLASWPPQCWESLTEYYKISKSCAPFLGAHGVASGRSSSIARVHLSLWLTAASPKSTFDSCSFFFLSAKSWYMWLISLDWQARKLRNSWEGDIREWPCLFKVLPRPSGLSHCEFYICVLSLFVLVFYGCCNQLSQI